MRQRLRTARWLMLTLAAIVAVAAISTYLTAPRPGGTMDPGATSPEGARALVSLLRDHGVEVVTADTLADAERAARPDRLLIVAQTTHLPTGDSLQRLSQLPGDLLLVNPTPKTTAALAPTIKPGKGSQFGGGSPDCALPEAIRAGDAELDLTDTFEAAGDTPVTNCYGGAVVRYTDGDHTVTVVGTTEFMSNAGLLKQGNAALAMNLAGARPTVVWYAPQHREGESGASATLSDLIPQQVHWMLLQVCLVVVLLAIWRGRRLGPLVSESLPVVVRASETVEGHGRLYRSQRARDRAAGALRTAALQRLLPRLGLTSAATPQAIAESVAARTGRDTATTTQQLFGPPPVTDADLVHLAHQLDDIERQVTRT